MTAKHSQILLNVNPNELFEQQVTVNNIEIEKRIVPVIVRPGHIRFQPLGKFRFHNLLLKFPQFKPRIAIFFRTFILREIISVIDVN